MPFNLEKYEPKKMSVERFEKYVTKHGIERSQGYFDAIKDVVENLEYFSYRKRAGTFEYDTALGVSRKVWDFRDEAEEMLKVVKRSKILKSKLAKENPTP